MFENFCVPAMFVSITAVLSLLASGRSTGLVLDIGDGACAAVPIYEGYSLPMSVNRIPLGGSHLTSALAKRIAERAEAEPSFSPSLPPRSLSSPLPMDLVRDVKQSLCYVALDYESEMEISPSSLQKTYELSSGGLLTLDRERFQIPEILFQPSLLGDSDYQKGIHEIAYSTVASCDIDVRYDLYRNLILTGGSTLFPGMADRIQKEMTDLAPSRSRILVLAPPERLYSTWIGGSILGSLSHFQQTLVTAEEYEESGAAIVHQKCF